MESGYPGTTVDAIATEAGVAVATVYKAFGTKAAIAREVNDLIDEEAAMVSFAERIAVENPKSSSLGPWLARHPGPQPNPGGAR